MTTLDLMGPKEARATLGAESAVTAEAATLRRVSAALREAAVARLRDEAPPNVVGFFLAQPEPATLVEITEATGLSDRHAMQQIRDLAAQDLVLVDEDVTPIAVHPIALFTEKNEPAPVA